MCVCVGFHSIFPVQVIKIPKEQEKNNENTDNPSLQICKRAFRISIFFGCGLVTVVYSAMALIFIVWSNEEEKTWKEMRVNHWDNYSCVYNIFMNVYLRVKKSGALHIRCPTYIFQVSTIFFGNIKRLFSKVSSLCCRVILSPSTHLKWHFYVNAHKVHHNLIKSNLRAKTIIKKSRLLWMLATYLSAYFRIDTSPTFPYALVLVINHIIRPTLHALYC